MRKLIYVLLAICIYTQSVSATGYRSKDNSPSEPFSTSSAYSSSQRRGYQRTTVNPNPENRPNPFYTDDSKSSTWVAAGSPLETNASFASNNDDDGPPGSGEGETITVDEEDSFVTSGSPVGDAWWLLVVCGLIYFVVIKKRRKNYAAVQL